MQIVMSGGFVPASYALTAIPSATVLGDGTVITSGPVPAIYPGPAIQPLQSTKVDTATVDGLVERAATLGLLDGPLDFGRPPVADAPDTEVTIVTGGETHRHAANALGISDDRAGGPGNRGLTAQAVANRKALSQFVEATQSLPPGDKGWTPTAVAVYDLGPYQADPQLPQRPVAWPLTTPPGARCMLVDGTEVPTLLRALASANALTPWTVAGAQHALAFRSLRSGHAGRSLRSGHAGRPVVPGQPGC